MNIKKKQDIVIIKTGILKASYWSNASETNKNIPIKNKL